MAVGEREVSVAVDAVRRASAVCAAVQKQLATAEALAKKDKSPVTVADYASQAVVCQALHLAFPADPVVAEEGTGDLRKPENEGVLSKAVQHARAPGIASTSTESVLAWIDHGATGKGVESRFWTLDPIDGTKGFLRGEQYAVALALIENGEVVLGVLGCPNLPDGKGATGVLLLATRGGGTKRLSLQGSSLAGEPVRVDSIADTALARFCESVESGHSDQTASASIARDLNITREPLRMDSQAKYAEVARGGASIYLRLPTRADYRECIWDHAAGKIVVEEAGGNVTDVDGKPLRFGIGPRLAENRGVIATNGRLHTRVVEVVTRHV